MDSSNLKEVYSSPVETDIKIIGDKSTVSQIVLLLAYIRAYLQSKEDGEIKVKIGKNMVSQFFAFQVNDQEIVQVKPKDELEIN